MSTTASPDEVYQAAVQLLARREHSRQQLVSKLRQRGFTPDCIDAVLSALAQQGLQSDARFTQSYITNRASRGYGPQRIRSELAQHGIAAAMISDFLDEDEEVWLQRALAVKMKKFGPGDGRDYNEQMKQKRFLQYRGFTVAQIRHVFADLHDVEG